MKRKARPFPFYAPLDPPPFIFHLCSFSPCFRSFSLYAFFFLPDSPQPHLATVVRQVSRMQQRATSPPVTSAYLAWSVRRWNLLIFKPITAAAMAASTNAMHLLVAIVFAVLLASSEGKENKVNIGWWELKFTSQGTLVLSARWYFPPEAWRGFSNVNSPSTHINQQVTDVMKCRNGDYRELKRCIQ